MQIHMCDICNTIGQPGIRWVRINLSPFTIQSANRYAEGPSFEEIYMDVCSIQCAIQKLREWDFIEIERPELKACMDPSPNLPFAIPDDMCR